MGTMTIDGRKVEFTDEKNVLTVIRNAGINIPTLCYHSEVSTFGACRLCTVEDDRGKTFASCSEQPRDGMVIYTNSGRIKKYRKLIVELLLAAHCRDCTTCVKSGECILQELAHRLVCVISALKIQENSTRSMTVHRPSSVIRTNVSSAATVYVPARSFRESELLDSHSVEQRPWSCLHSIKRLLRHSV